MGQSNKPMDFGNADLHTLLSKAASKIAYPRLKYRAPNNLGVIAFYIAGYRSRYKGHIMVTDGKPYGQNRYYGRIESEVEKKTSVFYPAADAYCTVEMFDTIMRAIGNPLEFAVMQGKELKFCCFCGKGLDNKNSRAVGYGPICASNYGLPWDGEAERIAAEQEKHDVEADL